MGESESEERFRPNGGNAQEKNDVGRCPEKDCRGPA
jgi:hypothetical protein